MLKQHCSCFIEVLGGKQDSYIAVVIEYLCYQHSSLALPQTHVITKISYSYCNVISLKIYFIDNQVQGNIFLWIHNLLEIFLPRIYMWLSLQKPSLTAHLSNNILKHWSTVAEYNFGKFLIKNFWWVKLWQIPACVLSSYMSWNNVKIWMVKFD